MMKKKQIDNSVMIQEPVLSITDKKIDYLNDHVEDIINGNFKWPNETMKEKAERLGVPIIEPLPKITEPSDPNPVVAICGECGMELSLIMGFSCGKNNCPCFPQISC